MVSTEMTSNGTYKKTKKKQIILFSSILASFTAILLAIILIVHSAPPAFAIHMPTLPKSVKHDDYESLAKANEEAASIEEAFINELNQFSYTSASLILNQSTEDKNSLYSPVSLFMATSMLTELANGQTQQELLNAFHISDTAKLREQTAKLFRSLFIDDGIAQLKLANSVWFDGKMKYNENTLNLLSKEYYAYSFGVDFSKKETSTAISKWIQEQTKGKLKKEESPANPNQILALYNTIYFYDEWAKQFDENTTKQDTFHLANGQTQKADFMNIVQNSHSYLQGDGFLASSLYFKQSGRMVFILPDEGVSLNDILGDSKKLSDALNPSSENLKNGEVTFKIPKFDFQDKVELNDALKSMGVQSAFDESLADFSSLTTQTKAFVSNVMQASTISINEKGAEAAAFTEIIMEKTSMPIESPDKVNMILDRPFIFAIMSNQNVPLFIGVINNPTLQ